METLNIVVGIILSLGGTCLAVPDAVKELGRRLRRDGARVAAKPRQFWRRLFGTPPIVAHLEPIITDVGFIADALAAERLVRPTGTTEQQIEGVWQEVLTVHAKVDRVRIALEAKDTELARGLQEARDEAERRHTELERQLALEQDQTREINASALPVLAFGTVLGGAAGLLAKWQHWANVLVLLVIIGFSVYAVWPILSKWIKKREEDTGSS